MATGTIYTTTDTATHPVGLSDVIGTLGWMEAPLLKLFGYSESNKSKLGGVTSWKSTELDWLEDTLSPLTSTLNGAHNDSVTTINVAAGHGVYFRKGDIIKVNNLEKMLVISVATDALTVETRPYGSTSAATYSGGEAVKIITRAMAENSVATLGHSTVVAKQYNYSQILDAAVSVSNTEMKVEHWADIGNPLDYQVAKLFNDGGRMGDLAQKLANIFYEGERVKRSATTPGSAGGFKTFVTTNKSNLAGASLQVSDIHNLMRTIRDNNGRVTHLIGNSWVMEKMNTFWPATERGRTESAGGQTPFRSVDTPHGSIQLVYDWMCPAGEIYMVDEKLLGWLPLRPFERTDATIPGTDGVTEKIVGEYTFFARLQNSHGYIYNASTTA